MTKREKRRIDKLGEQMFKIANRHSPQEVANYILYEMDEVLAKNILTAFPLLTMTFVSSVVFSERNCECGHD